MRKMHLTRPHGSSGSWRFALFLATALVGPGSAQAADCAATGEEVAQVVGVSGPVVAIGADGVERSLACDDMLEACDEVRTSESSRAALLIDDVFVQVDERSAARIHVGGDRPTLALLDGGVRVIDTRSGGDGGPFSVLVGDGSVEGLGSDTEVFSRGGLPSACSNSGSHESSGVASACAAGPQIGGAPEFSCEFDVGQGGLFNPVDVSFGGLGFPAIEPPGGIVRMSCDNPGSGCGSPGPAPIPPLPPGPTPQGAATFLQQGGGQCTTNCFPGTN
jgi:hypothetical protein